MRTLLRALLIIAACVLVALPIAVYLGGRDGLVLPFVAVGLAAVCSFLAYYGAVVLRRKIDQIGAGGTGRAHGSDSERRARR